MNVVEIQNTSVENMFVTMSSIGNIYFNTVIFQLRYLFPNLFVNEEEIFYLLGGVGFSYRCRRSKRKGTRIYTPTHQLNFRQLFALLHQAEWIDGSKDVVSKHQNRKTSLFPSKEGHTEGLQVERNELDSLAEQMFHYDPKTILEFRNAICEGLTKDRDIIFATYQHHQSSMIENPDFDPFDLISVHEDIMIDISNEILSYSKKLSKEEQSKEDQSKEDQSKKETSNSNSDFYEEHYGQICLYRLIEYNSVLVRVWDAKNKSLHVFSFRDFWKMFDKIEVFTVPQNICRRKMYAYAFHSIYESQTKTGGNLEGFIELQNALRRKSIRNSWWTLFCEDVSHSIKKSDETYNSNKTFNDKNAIVKKIKKSQASHSIEPANSFPSHIDKVISQLYVQLVLTTNGGYRKDMSRICQVLGEQIFNEGNSHLTTNKASDWLDTKTIDLGDIRGDIRLAETTEQIIKKKQIKEDLVITSQNKEIQEILQEIASLYISSSKKILFLGELLLSIHTPEAYRIRRGIDVFVANCGHRHCSAVYPSGQSIGANQFEQPYHSQTEISWGDQKEKVDWQSYFDLMDDTISRILEIESRIARKTLEISNILFGVQPSQNTPQSEEVA